MYNEKIPGQSIEELRVKKRLCWNRRDKYARKCGFTGYSDMLRCRSLVIRNYDLRNKMDIFEFEKKIMKYGFDDFNHYAQFYRNPVPLIVEKISEHGGQDIKKVKNFLGKNFFLYYDSFNLEIMLSTAVIGKDKVFEVKDSKVSLNLDNPELIKVLCEND